MTDLTPEKLASLRARAEFAKPVVSGFGFVDRPSTTIYAADLLALLDAADALTVKPCETCARHDAYAAREAEQREAPEPEPAPYTRRLASCVERWPGCESGAYDPACCRFPKSCSPHGNHPDDELEPQPAGTCEPDITVYCHVCGAEITAPPREALAALRAHADGHAPEPDQRPSRPPTAPKGPLT